MAADPCLLLFTLLIALTLMNEICSSDAIWAIYISCSMPLPSEHQCLGLLGDLSDPLSLCADERCCLIPLAGDALSLHLLESLPPTSNRPKNLLCVTSGAGFGFSSWESQPVPRRGFAFGEFWNDLQSSTHHSIFYSPNWDIFTTFSIKPKLDYLGFELETFSRRLEKMSLRNYENQKTQW